MYWKEGEGDARKDHVPAMQSSLLPEVRRLHVELSQHIAAMALPSCVVAASSCTHASVRPDAPLPPSRMRTPWEGKGTAGGGGGGTLQRLDPNIPSPAGSPCCLASSSHSHCL